MSIATPTKIVALAQSMLAGISQVSEADLRSLAAKTVDPDPKSSLSTLMSFLAKRELKKRGLR